MNHILLAFVLFVWLLLPYGEAKEIVVIQKEKTFRLESNGKPVKTLQAKISDVIKFKNEDSITHNVYSITRGNEFELKVQRPGETGDVPLHPKSHRPGKMEVECAIHPGMKLTVDIKK